MLLKNQAYRWVNASEKLHLVALLFPAMLKGEDIYVGGAVSERLYYNLSGPFQKLLRTIIPSLRLVKIFVKDFTRSQKRPLGVATGFSGGVDSYCVLADHHYANVASGFKLTHLLFNNVGTHGGFKNNAEQLFRRRYEHIAPVAERIGLPLVMVNSNVNQFYGNEFGYGQTHTLRNASVALLLQGGVGRYMYASAYGYQEVDTRESIDLAHSDLITLPMLSTETLDAFSVGSEYTRVEKTIRVAEIPESYTSLDVCIRTNHNGNFINCSRCSKCFRTLATLEIAGVLDRYCDSFDLETYRFFRIAYFSEIRGDDDNRDKVFEKEIMQFARMRDYSFPVASCFIRSMRLSRYVKYLIKKLYKLKRSNAAA